MEKVTLLTDESPFTMVSPVLTVPGAAAPAAAPSIGGSDDWYGACSLEKFAGGVGGLTYTHEDAEGFLDYPTKFRNANFWYKDGSVQPWLYGETYDNWQDTYGADAVTAFYHSGHGGMDANGVFSIPLGASWGGSSWANSSQMFLGNEEVRYLFFSTCNSCRVLDGQSPVKTWWNSCLGFRMLFGFETTSIDSPDYGKFFWEEWRPNKPNGKSMSQAWLDASWRIYHNQAPSAVAVGATQAEALDRLTNEKYFDRAAATKGWMQWRWYYASAANLALLRQPQPPAQLSRIEFRPTENRMADVRRVAGDLGFTQKSFGDAGIDPAGNLIINSGDKQVVVQSNGAREYTLGVANLANKKPIDQGRARQLAEDAVQQLNLGYELAIDTVRVGYTAGGTSAGSGQVDKGHQTDIGVLFRPLVNGLTNVNQDHGNLMVTVDNDGTVVGIRDTTRVVADVRPIELNFKDTQGPRPNSSVTRLLQEGIRGRYGRAKTTLLPDTVSVGYDFSGKTGNVVAQGTFEVDFGHNMRKRALIRVPLSV